ncbi:MBL fold metallo-hydrolase, partial [Rhizobium ruizarguesonis]
IPAHGRTHSPSSVDDNLAYFQALSDRVGSLSEIQLADPQLGGSSGLRLEDFVPIPYGMPSDVAAFYRNCHETNLGATVQAHIEKLKFA